MTLRSAALRWLADRNVKGGHVVTSKLYAPHESWTKAKAWWVQIPAAPIETARLIHIVCEAETGSSQFRHLAVPPEFLQSHLDDFATIGDNKINLFLAADEGIEFQDQRGSGRVSFAEFEQK
jgi:hypothetical protein